MEKYYVIIMVDDSNLDYLRTVLGFMHASATVKHYSEVKNINRIDDTERILIFPPELISVDNNHYTERYMVKLSETNEAGLLGMRNDIINNIILFNRRAAIGAYTYETTFIYMELKHSNKAFENGITKRWEQDLFIDCTFSTS